MRASAPIWPIAAAILLACGCSVAAHGPHDPRAQTHEHASGHPGAHPRADGDTSHRHDFSDAERFARIFDDPDRDQWQRPAEVVTLLELAPGMTVVDLGAGTGYFVPHLAEAVGPEGRVLALDVEPNMVRHMRARFEAAGLENVSARVVPPDRPGLEAGSVDRILIVDTWHHISQRERYAALLRESLRPGGAVYVVDFTTDSPHGPPVEMRLDAEQVSAELFAAGLEVEVLPESLPWQYVVRGRTRR